MRLAALQSLVNAVPAGLSGCPRPARRHDFSRAFWLHFLRRPPSSCEFRVHPLVSFASSSEYDRLEPARRTNASSAFLEVPAPHRGINSGDPLATGFPIPDLRSVLGVSHALDGFRPPLPRGLVSSHNHVRDSPSRGFPRHPAEPPRRRPVPSCRWSSVPTAGCPTTPAPMPSPSGP